MPNFTPFFADRLSFRAKGLGPKVTSRSLTSVFADQPLFRAKWLHVVAPRWHRPWPKERRSKEGEGESERGTERERDGETEGDRGRERERGEERRCENERMICVDVKKRGCKM